MLMCEYGGWLVELESGGKLSDILGFEENVSDAIYESAERLITLLVETGKEEAARRIAAVLNECLP